MLLFAETITPRLRYITGFIGEALTGEPLELTTDIQVFEQYPGPKINYSSRHISVNDLQVHPAGLLFEEGIRPQEIHCANSNEYVFFFESGGDHPFDIFAASFYLLSRYEEYLPCTHDLYGRFPHTASLAFNNGFLDQPLVNYWLKELAALLKTRFPDFIPKEQVFTFLPTYDIDEAFSFLNKGLIRNTGGFLRDFFTGNFKRCRQRIQVLTGHQPDPFDSFEQLHRLHTHYTLDPLYFFLLASRKGMYDKNTDPAHSAMQALITAHAEKYRTGIHPSWQSGDKDSLLIEEKGMLETITGKPVTLSRQHFLRFTLPEGYRRLLAAGITEDHSMGYGMINGFRASVASPFYWYDLENETTTDLRICPFCYMDANSFYELKHTPAQALEQLLHYYKEVRNVNGMLVTLWHNTFLGTDPKFMGWKEVYEDFLKEVHQE